MIESRDMTTKRASLCGRNPRRVGVFIAIASALTSFNAKAELDDFFIAQRVGWTQSRGSLAGERQRLGLQTSLSQSFKSFPWGVAFDFGHEWNFYTDSFLTRGDDSLYFPLIPERKAFTFEPSIEQNLCLFSMSNYHLCFSAGLSLVRLQNDPLNFQNYVGIPVGIRMTYVPDSSPVIWEVGVRYRNIHNRTSGYTNTHEDLFSFVSLGLASIQSR
jgi:hypothetical protein